jgi:two-component system NtrC family sensor kinase
MDPQFAQEVDLNEFRERLDAIIETTLRGRNITRNLLAFAREHEPVLEWLDVNALIDKVLNIKDLEFRISNIDICRRFDDSLPKVLLNANQMEQVLFNLLHNARDAIERDGKITVQTQLKVNSKRGSGVLGFKTPEPNLGCEILIDVEDTGCGMSEEQMEKIFFPFYTTKGVGKGTGLGLSISYGIMRSFGGRIEVKSLVGRGTTFTLVLPVRDGETQ